MPDRVEKRPLPEVEIVDMKEHKNAYGKEIQVLGPVEAPMSRLKRKHRWQLLLKSRSVSILRHLLVEAEQSSLKALRSRGVHLISDVDPYDML